MLPIAARAEPPRVTTTKTLLAAHPASAASIAADIRAATSLRRFAAAGRQVRTGGPSGKFIAELPLQVLASQTFPLTGERPRSSESIWTGSPVSSASAWAVWRARWRSLLTIFEGFSDASMGAAKRACAAPTSSSGMSL